MSKRQDKRKHAVKFNPLFPYKRDPFMKVILAEVRAQPGKMAVLCLTAGISPSTLYAMANGETSFPHHRTYALIAAAMGMEVRRTLVRRR